MITIPIEHLVKIKIRRVNQQQIQYTIVRIIDHIKLDKTTNSIMYVGVPISNAYTQDEINFFKHHIIYEFGDITEKELIENYPEYVI